MKRLLWTAAFALAAAPALAGGLIDPAPEPVVTAPPMAVSPNGDWGGFYVGAQLGFADVSTDIVDADGALGGLHAGYRWDFGRTVIGGELDINATDVSSDDDLAELDSLVRLKFMAGADLGRTLLYGTLGAAQAKATIGDDSFRDVGLAVGIGMDYALTDTWSLGGEVVYHRFDNFDDQDIDVDATTLQLRTSFKF